MLKRKYLEVFFNILMKNKRTDKNISSPLSLNTFDYFLKNTCELIRLLCMKKKKTRLFARLLSIYKIKIFLSYETVHKNKEKMNKYQRYSSFVKLNIFQETIFDR